MWGGGGGVDSFIGSACVLHIKERSRGLMSNILSLLSGCISCHQICYRSASLGTDPFFMFYVCFIFCIYCSMHFYSVQCSDVHVLCVCGTCVCAVF